jgi:hypothetical protein
VGRAGGWRAEGGGWRAEGGRRRVEGGRRRAEGGGQRAEEGGGIPLRAASEQNLTFVPQKHRFSFPQFRRLEYFLWAHISLNFFLVLVLI